MKRLIGLLLLSFLSVQGFTCTTAIISGKYTKDGRPILWKHRDTDNLQNAIKYFNDGNYDYVALIDATDPEGTMVWAGYNSKGFAIMNNASYNLKPKNDDTKIADLEGYLMKKALMYCASLSDFEKMLDTMKKPLGVEANFGCIDAKGGAAYYETNNFQYFKIDVNNPAIAPFGYVVKTNYSNFGSPDDGYGYIRYIAAEELFYKAAAAHRIDPKFILQQGSRYLTHGLTKTNLYDVYTNTEEKYVAFEDYIIRYSTSSSIVVHGIDSTMTSNQIVMWTCLGWPLTSVSIPVWLHAQKVFPKSLILNKDGVAPLCNASLKLKENAFPITRGSGYKYLNINALLNTNGNGIYQKLIPLENQIFMQANKLLTSNAYAPDEKQIAVFYAWLDDYLNKNYFILLDE